MASEEQVFIQCTVGGPVRVFVKDGKIVRMELNGAEIYCSLVMLGKFEMK